MEEKKRKRTAGSPAKGKKTQVPKRKEIDVPDISRAPGTPIFAEIGLWVMLAVCIILMLSNFFGIGGMIGNAISRFFFGMFGVMAYLIPFLLFFATAFLIANRGSVAVWVKTGAGILLLLCICGFCELLFNQYEASRSFADYYRVGSELKTGGGTAGALLCKILCPFLNTVATWICITVLAIIAIILMTGKSFIDSINRKSRSAIGNAKSGKTMRRELHELKKEKNQLQKQKRMQNRIEKIKAENEGLQLEVREPRRNHPVSGMTSNLTFDAALPVAEEIHEVTPKVRKKTDAAKTPLPKEASVSEKKQTVRAAKKTKEGEKEPFHTRAKQMVDSIEPEQPAEQMNLNFTIQRNGVQEPMQEMPAFTAAEIALSSDSRQDLQMPKIGRVSTKAISEAPVKNEPVPEVMPEVNFGSRTMKQPRSSKEEQAKEMENVAAEIAQAQQEQKPKYVYPPVGLLSMPAKKSLGNSDAEVKKTAVKLQQTLHNFGVNVTVTNVSCGPTVTRYELMPEQGVKVSRIVNLSDDIKLNLAAADIRIEAPIPGKPAVGIEVPNKEKSGVMLRELIESSEFQNAPSKLSFAVGKDISGKNIVADIAKMPHLLIAGATGSGKSVCINTLIMSILYKADPEEVKLIMIDPKVVELSVYNGIPHLFIPVVTDPKKASGALNWGVAEMTDRYNKFAECGVRDLKGYNAKVEALADVDDPNKPKKLPQIVIIVDELADLMMVAPGEVEDAICRLAQLARAAGIHLIIATQRPSVNVITGVIKANMPSRIAFSVTSGVDSRTIIDMNGAEKLLGKGDMLFYPQGYQKPVRVQGALISDTEVSDVTDFLRNKNDISGYSKEMEERISKVQQAVSSVPGASSSANDIDSYFVEAGKFIIEKEKASIGMLQRVFKIGFNRAARIMDQLSEAGVVGPEEGTKLRKVLMSMEEFEQYVDEYI